MGNEEDLAVRKIISSNLSSILEEYNINQRDLAKIAGVSESTAGKWILMKAVPRMGPIQRIADHFNLPKSYILNERPSNMYPITTKTIPIPVLGEIACGDPITADENVSEYRSESPDNLPGGNVYYVKAKGVSMEPTIPDGSFVLIREQPTVEYGEIAAVLVNDDTEVTLKRVKKQSELIMLVPDNPEHEPLIITKDNPAKILGKAIRYTQDL